MRVRKYIGAFLRAIINFYKFKILKKHLFSTLTDIFVTKEIVFNVPPFNRRIIQAINLISPQYVLQVDEQSRRFWQAYENACCWAEYEVLSKYLLTIPKPGKCLEIGPGMGRSIVFFTKKLNWQETAFHLYESAGKHMKYTMGGPRFTDSFCGTIEILEDFLKYNNVENYRIFDACKLEYKLSNLPGPYDVIYCFYGIGFHWALENFIDEIFTLMHEKTLAFFIVHSNFEVFKKLKKVNFKIIDYMAAYPANNIYKMLLMSKGAIE